MAGGRFQQEGSGWTSDPTCMPPGHSGDARARESTPHLAWKQEASKNQGTARFLRKRKSLATQQQAFCWLAVAAVVSRPRPAAGWLHGGHGSRVTIMSEPAASTTPIATGLRQWRWQRLRQRRRGHVSR
jgi:hypothetical protein